MRCRATRPLVRDTSYHARQDEPCDFQVKVGPNHILVNSSWRRRGVRTVGILALRIEVSCAVARSHKAEAASVASKPSKRILWQEIPELGAQRRKRLRNLETPKILIG